MTFPAYAVPWIVYNIKYKCVFINSLRSPGAVVARHVYNVLGSSCYPWGAKYKLWRPVFDLRGDLFLALISCRFLIFGGGVEGSRVKDFDVYDYR